MQSFEEFQLEVVIYTEWLQKKWLPQKSEDI